MCNRFAGLDAQSALLLVQVGRHLDEHPEASANDVARQVEGRRGDVLAAVKLLRMAGMGSASTQPVAAPSGRFPSPGYHAAGPCFDGEDDPDSELARIRAKFPEHFE